MWSKKHVDAYCICLVLPNVVLFVAAVLMLAHDAKCDSEKFKPGLIGAWYGASDLTNCKDADRIVNLDLVWDNSNSHGKSWSAKWEGLVTAPITGNLVFQVETSHSAALEIDGKRVVQVCIGQTERSADFSTLQDREYPITVIYFHEGGLEGHLAVRWSWKGQQKGAHSGREH